MAISVPGAINVCKLLPAFSMEEITGGVGAVTVRVTVIVCAGFDALDPVTVTVPVYVPAARLAGFTRSVSGVAAPVDALVAPDAGSTASQLPVEVAAAVKLMGAPLLVRFTVRFAGAGELPVRLVMARTL